MGKTYKDKVRGKYRRECKKRDTRKLVLKTAHYVENNQVEVIHYKGRDETEPSPWMKAWDALSQEDQLRVINYSKSPSWFNRLFHTRPRRRESRDLLKKVDLKQEENSIDPLFPHAKKPKTYYW